MEKAQSLCFFLFMWLSHNSIDNGFNTPDERTVWHMLIWNHSVDYDFGWVNVSQITFNIKYNSQNFKKLKPPKPIIILSEGTVMIVVVTVIEETAVKTVVLNMTKNKKPFFSWFKKQVNVTEKWKSISSVQSNLVTSSKQTVFQELFIQ